MRITLLLLLLAQAAHAQPVAHAQTDTIDAADYGVVAGVAQVDQTPALQRAYTAARRTLVAARASGGDPSVTVVLPCHAPYRTSGLAIWYQGVITVHPAIETQGCGGARVVRATAPDGSVYYPVREVADYEQNETRLRVMDGASGRRQPTLRNEPVTRITVARPRAEWRTAPAGIVPRNRAAARAEHGAWRDLVFDGNEPGNLAGVRAAIAAGRAENLYRNAPGYTALNVSEQDGVPACVVPPGARYSAPGTFVALERVSMGGYAAAVLVGGSCVQWTASEVRAGDSAYNHVLYGLPGTWTDLTLYGHAWTHVILRQRTEITRLVYEMPTRNPLDRAGPSLLDARENSTTTIRGFTSDVDATPAPWRTLNGTRSPGRFTQTATAETRPPNVWTPNVASPAAPVARYRIEVGRRCRDLVTGRRVTFVPNCSSLE